MFVQGQYHAQQSPCSWVEAVLVLVDAIVLEVAGLDTSGFPRPCSLMN